MATRTPNKISNPQELIAWQWEQLTENDTAAELKWPGGEGYIEVKGTPGGATLQMNFGLTSGALVALSVSEAPDGAKFSNTTGFIQFEAPPGYLQPVATSGTSQDFDITVVSKAKA